MRGRFGVDSELIRLTKSIRIWFGIDSMLHTTTVYLSDDKSVKSQLSSQSLAGVPLRGLGLLLYNLFFPLDLLIWNWFDSQKENRFSFDSVLIQFQFDSVLIRFPFDSVLIRFQFDSVLIQFTKWKSIRNGFAIDSGKKIDSHLPYIFMMIQIKDSKTGDSHLILELVLCVGIRIG